MSAARSPNQLNPEPSSLSRLPIRPGSAKRTSGAINVQTIRYSVLLGGISGCAFSSAMWAYETIQLFRAHVAYPWMPFLVGTIFFTIICTLAALLTCLMNRALLGVVFWVLAARLIAYLVIEIPLKIVPGLMMFFEPGLRSRLPGYPINATFRSWEEIGTIGLAIFLGILGLLQLTLVDQAVPAASPAGRLIAYFVFIPIIFLASAMLSDMINQPLEAPLAATNDLVQFAVDNQNTHVDPLIARQEHLGSVGPIAKLINRPRRLFLGSYDTTFSQVEVLIDFSGEWVNCTTVSLQPVFCQIK